MQDDKAEEADMELQQTAEGIRRKYDISFQTMNYLAASLAQGYAVKAIAQKELDGSGT